MNSHTYILFEYLFAVIIVPFLRLLSACALCLYLFRIWNYEEDTLLNSFDNHDYADKGISKLSLVNELDDSLLLVASCKLHYFCLISFMVPVKPFNFD